MVDVFEIGMSVCKWVVMIFISWLFVVTANAGAMLQEINGQEISFTDLRGQWVFINYWASWCQPCLDEISELNRFHENNKKVALFAVNYEALPTQMQKQLIKQFDIHYPSLKKDPAHALKLENIRGIPVTFVFNPQGELSDTLYGAQTMDSLREVIASN